MSLPDLLMGLIWSGFLGLAIGNFATNPIFRLPRNFSLFGEDPYCDTCKAPLKPIDLFPIFSWLSTKGKCRYCGGVIPGAYTVVEALILQFFMLSYLKFGFNEQFILVSFGLTCFVMLGAMLHTADFFSNRTFVACAIFGMLYRTLGDASIYGFAATAYAGILVGALVWKLSGQKMVRDFAAFPGYLKLLTLAGIWLHFNGLFVLLCVCAAALPFRKRPNFSLLIQYTIIVCSITGVILG